LEASAQKPLPRRVVPKPAHCSPRRDAEGQPAARRSGAERPQTGNRSLSAAFSLD